MRPDDEKPQQAGGPARDFKKGIDTRHSTASDPLQGWFSLAANAKPSRGRPPKRGWQRGAKR